MANRLKQLLSSNQEIKEKLNQAKTPDEAYKAIAEQIPHYTKEDLAADLKEIQGAEHTLSDDELEAVAGGVSRKDIYVSDEEFFKRLLDIFDLFSD